MKNTVITIILLCFGHITFSQNVPNNDFEDWTSHIFYEEPDSWNTPDSIVSLITTATVTKSNDAYTGNYCARLETKNILGQITVPGLLTLAEFTVNIDSLSYNVTGGMAFQENVSSLSGMYKYQGVDGDSASIIMYNYTRDMDGNYDSIGVGIGTLPDASTWTVFTIDMENLNYHVPDTFNVVILSSKAPDFQVGSVLWVDNLNIETNTGILSHADNQIIVDVYPNPSSDFVVFETTEIENNRQIKIYNTIGKLVSVNDFSQYEIKVPVIGFPSGYYSYQVVSHNNILNSGSFIKK